MEYTISCIDSSEKEKVIHVGFTPDCGTEQRDQILNHILYSNFPFRKDEVVYGLDEERAYIREVSMNEKIFSISETIVLAKEHILKFDEKKRIVNDFIKEYFSIN